MRLESFRTWKDGLYSMNITTVANICVDSVTDYEATAKSR